MARSEPPPEAPEDRPPRILVVDDEQSVRELLMTILRDSAGYELLEAANGVEARKILQAGPVDVAIVDLLMPRMNGLSLMRWAQEHCPGATWIILSGRGTFDDAVQAVQLGAFDFITKPLDAPETLTVTVRNALSQRRLAEERQRLLRDVEQRNAALGEQVAQLEEACRLLCRQHETLDEDLHRAELIQRALLPYTPPPLEGFAFDAVYRPSRNVGGDLYDVVQVNDRHVVLYVADAAGHGVSAAMLAVLFKHRLGMTDGQTHEPLAPSAALTRVNAHIRYECSAPGLFVTAAYCLLDTDAKTLTVASAGHPPLVLLRADGRREMVYHSGPALGLAMDATYAEETFTLDAGDQLLLYTDGLHDVVSRSDAQPAEAIADVLAGLEGDGWERLHKLLNLLAEARETEGQEDDVTAVLLTAGHSTSSIDNGQPTSARSPVGAAASPAAEVLMGSTEGAAAVSVRGRGCWMHCVAFHDACAAQIEAGRKLVVDLSVCEYLDSTFLGTLKELAGRANEAKVPLAIQGALPAVRGLFEELEMQSVLSHFTEEMRPLPRRMMPLTSCIDDKRNRRRMLEAHEALASLSERNRQEFVHLIEHLRAEVDRLEAAGDDKQADT